MSDEGTSEDRHEKVRDHVEFVGDEVGARGPAEGGGEPEERNGDADGDTREELPDEARELLAELEAQAEDDPAEEPAAAGDAGPSGGPGDETDERVERFGNYAGVLVLPVLAAALFVGPWRLFDFSLAAGTIPFTVREGASGNVLLAPLPVILLVGLAAGGLYRATTDDRPEEYRSDMAIQIVVVEVLVVAAAYLLVLLVVSGNAVLQGELLGAVIVLVAGVVGLLFFSFFEFVAISIAVGIPAYVGVFLGDLLGAAARKMDT